MTYGTGRMLLTYIVAMASIALLLIVIVGDAHAWEPRVCLRIDAAIAKLKKDYNEHQVGLGAGPGGKTAVGLYLAEDGSFTITETRTNGMTCILTTGKGWQSVPLRKGGVL